MTDWERMAWHKSGGHELDAQKIAKEKCDECDSGYMESNPVAPRKEKENEKEHQTSEVGPT